MNTVEFPKLGLSFTMNTGFNIGPIHITFYGLIIFIGFSLALIFAFKHFRKSGVDPDKAINCIIAGTLGGIVGARIYFVAFKWDNYGFDFSSWDNFWKSFLHVINITEGGLAIYGGLIGALIAGIITAKICKVCIPALLDIVGVGFLIGQGIGRWGNFVNAEAFGSNTNLPWGMTGPTIQNYLSSISLPGVDPSVPVHPCFLYESIWCLIGFFLLAAYYKHRKYDGEMFMIYLAYYGFGRMFIEGLRTDSLMIGPIRISQLLALILVITSIAILIYKRIMLKKGKTKPLFATTEKGLEIVNFVPEKSEWFFSKKTTSKQAEDKALEDEKNTETIIKEDQKDNFDD